MGLINFVLFYPLSIMIKLLDVLFQSENLMNERSMARNLTRFRQYGIVCHHHRLLIDFLVTSASSTRQKCILLKKCCSKNVLCISVYFSGAHYVLLFSLCITFESIADCRIRIAVFGRIFGECFYFL